MGGPDGQKAGIIVRDFDKYIASLKKADVDAGDVTELSKNLVESRAEFSTSFKMKEVISAVTKAKRSAMAVNGNVAGAIKSKLRALRNNDKKMKGFNDEELDALDLIIEGKGLQTVLESVGKRKFGAVGGGMASMGGAGALGMTGAVSPQVAIALGVGAPAGLGAARHWARKRSNSIINDRVNSLQDTISNPRKSRSGLLN